MKNPLTFDIITLFPDLFHSFLNESLIGKGILKGELEELNSRIFENLELENTEGLMMNHTAAAKDAFSP